MERQTVKMEIIHVWIQYRNAQNRINITKEHNES